MQLTPDIKLDRDITIARLTMLDGLMDDGTNTILTPPMASSEGSKQIADLRFQIDALTDAHKRAQSEREAALQAAGAQKARADALAEGIAALRKWYNESPLR